MGTVHTVRASNFACTHSHSPTMRSIRLVYVHRCIHADRDVLLYLTSGMLLIVGEQKRQSWLRLRIARDACALARHTNVYKNHPLRPLGDIKLLCRCTVHFITYRSSGPVGYSLTDTISLFGLSRWTSVVYCS